MVEIAPQDTDLTAAGAYQKRNHFLGREPHDPEKVEENSHFHLKTGSDA